MNEPQNEKDEAPSINIEMENYNREATIQGRIMPDPYFDPVCWIQ